jgi:SAM-dependent methyltransferase
VSHSLDIPLDWFVCPITKEPLRRLEDGLTSSRATYRFVRPAGYWDFAPQASGELERAEWKTWAQLQENGLVSYAADPEHNLGVGKRDDFLEFARFCGFRGRVLDVGVGPQRCPTHIAYCEAKDVFFVGIDPLVGEQPRQFAFVRGLGEYLPFRSGLFDQVLFVTSLDHFIDPRPALAEAARVLGPRGELFIWIGEKEKNAPKATRSNDWYERLAVPEGAEDRFHYKRFSAGELEAQLAEMSLQIAERSVARIDAWRSNLFYRIRPDSRNARD